MAEADPKDFVLVPLDRSYGDNSEYMDPMFRSAHPEPDDYALESFGTSGFRQESDPMFRSALSEPDEDDVKSLGTLGVRQGAEPEYRSGCKYKVSVKFKQLNITQVWQFSYCCTADFLPTATC